MRNFLEEVEFGRKGGKKGLKMGLPRFSKFVNNIQKAIYVVIGALQKTGKTAFVDHCYVLSPYLYEPNAKVNWIYFSYEIDRIEKMAKFCAYFMQIKYDILCDSNYILSRGDKKLADEHVDLVNKIYSNELVDLFGEYDSYGKCIKKGRIDFHEDKENPTGIYKYLMQYARDNGEFIKEKYVVDGKEYYRTIGYKENDPELTTIIILDHIGLMKKERGYNKKENIDKMSEYFVWLRNICQFTPVVMSQFNRDLGKTDRLKFNGEQLQPTMEDFKDSGNTGEDASLVIALFDAGRYPHIKKHLGYDLSKVGKGYRSAHILASRNTETGVNISLKLYGQTGLFEELEKTNTYGN